jgi:Flp pilus assembly pilin Flp
MMKLMMKGYVAAQLKTEEFLKDNRGSIIEYVMIIALAGVLITAATPDLKKIITDLVAAAKNSVTTTS